MRTRAAPSGVTTFSIYSTPARLSAAWIADAPDALDAWTLRAQALTRVHKRAEARAGEEQATLVEHLQQTLDYRQWFRFRIFQIRDGERHELTRHCQGFPRAW